MEERTSATRREVLKYSAAAAVGAVVLKAAMAGGQTRDSALKVALISDIHLGKDGEVPSKQFEMAVAEINAWGPALTMCCGDLVNEGENPANEKRYPEWMKIASGLKMPWHAVPGNHDPDALFVKHIRPKMDFVVDADGWRFICFRDAEPNPGHMGMVSGEQVKWIGAQIDEAKRAGHRSVLFSHVCYHQNQKPDHGWMISKGREAFTQMLEANAKAISLHISGHHHMGMRGWDDAFGFTEVMLPSSCWNFATELMAAPGFAYAERRPGWVMAELGERRITLQYKPVGEPGSVTREISIG